MAVAMVEDVDVGGKPCMKKFWQVRSVKVMIEVNGEAEERSCMATSQEAPLGNDDTVWFSVA